MPISAAASQPTCIPVTTAALGQAYARSGRLAEGVSLLQQALAAFGLGRVFPRTEERDQARGHLATATTMNREMAMTYRWEKAQAAMAELA
jgi:hypothetical protein